MKRYFKLISFVLAVVGLISFCVGCSMLSQARSVAAANMAEKQAAEEENTYIFSGYKKLKSRNRRKINRLSL